MQKIYMIDKENDRINRWFLQRLFHRLPVSLVTDLQIYRTKNSGKDVDVYLVDSEIDTAHPEFATSQTNITRLDSANFSSSNEHGTAMASLIIGKNLGLAANANLISVPCFNEVGRSEPQNLKRAFKAIVEHRQQRLSENQNLAICCMPFISHDPELQVMVRQLTELRILCIAASGDRNKISDEYFPAASNEVLTVAAMDKEDQLATNFPITLADGSTRLASTNRGDAVDLMAPGVDVTVAKDQDYELKSGSSMSAALVTGLATHFINSNSFSTPQQLKEAILSSATLTAKSDEPPIAFYPFSGTPLRWLGSFYIGVYSAGDKVDFPLVIEQLNEDQDLKVEMLDHKLPFDFALNERSLTATVPESLVHESTSNHILTLRLSSGTFQQDIKLTLRLAPENEKAKYQELHQAQAAFKSFNFVVSCNPNLPSNGC